MMDPEQITILNVDDDEAARYAKTRLLRTARYRIIEAQNGADAIRLAQSEQPHVALVDVHLPDMSGLDVSRHLKNNPETARMMILQISASYVSGGDKVKGLSGGADAYVTEPIEGEELLAIVQALLRLRAREQEIHTLVDQLKKAAEEREQLLSREQIARATAEAANRLKDEFLATVSHELRTPLNAVFGWVRMARSGMLDKAGMERALETIERNARSQSQLIDDLLDVSRIITGRIRLDIRSIDFTAVIQTAIETIRPTADNKGVRLQIVLDPHAGAISGDSDRLQQVVWNLLSNAIKFTPKNGRVQVRLERVNSHVELTVSDTGEGIHPEFIPYVFDRFRQGDATMARKYGGLGLGLAIVRHLVELHGGTVHVFSGGEHQGATFTVKLPIVMAKDGQIPSTPPVSVRRPTDATSFVCPESLEGMCVLAVEDDADARHLLVTILESCKATVIAVPTVSEALQVLDQVRPDVLVSDIEMPEEDGYALIKAVQARTARDGRRIPAVALTAHTRSDDRHRVLASGFDVHVPKPFEPPELIGVIDRLVKPRSPQG